MEYECILDTITDSSHLLTAELCQETLCKIETFTYALELPADDWCLGQSGLLLGTTLDVSVIVFSPSRI